MVGEKQSYWAVVPAAGVGKRMQAATSNNIPKQYMEIQGRTILEHTLDRLSQVSGLSGIVLVVGEHDEWWQQLDSDLKDKVITVPGGEYRVRSVFNGLAALQGKADEKDWVLVHDAVRPCVTLQDINSLMNILADDEIGGLLASPVRDTLKKVSDNLTVSNTVPREEYWLAGTPQMFRYAMLKDALEQALADNVQITDESHAMEYAGHPVKIVHGSAENIKITHAEDLFMAELILKSQAEQ